MIDQVSRRETASAFLNNRWRGLMVVFTIAACAMFLSDHHRIPVMLSALLIGIAFNFLSGDERCAGGIDFAARPLLRVGVALLGFRVNFELLEQLGWQVPVALLALIATTIGFGVLVTRLAGRRLETGLLTAGAVAICGASAAVALASVMPRREGLQNETLFTVIAVTALSTVAMVLYPLLTQWMALEDWKAGFVLGASIHDVAQVVGAGYSVNDETGIAATFVKLLRVSALPLVLVAVTLVTRTQEKGSVAIPGFVIAFLLFMVVANTGFLPEAVISLAAQSSQWLLIAGISALGIKTSAKVMFGLGGFHILIILAETVLLLGATVLIATHWLA